MDNNLVKILPIGQPIIASFPNYANPLCILQLNESSKLWYLSNLSVLSCIKNVSRDNELELGIVLFNDSSMFLGCNLWEICPYLFANHIDRNVIVRDGIVTTIINNISVNHYCYFYVEMSCVEVYKKIHGPHDIFIYGFDLENKVFFAADFFRGKYEQKAIPFSQIERGYMEVTEHPMAVMDHFITITDQLPSFRKKRLQIYEEHIGADTYREIIIERIFEYLRYRWNSNYMCKNTNIVYGIDVYDAFIECFCRNKIFNYNLVSALCLFKDHKIIMTEICKEYNLSEHVKKTWEQVVEKVRILINLYLKYGMVKEELKIKISKNIVNELKELKKKDLYAMSMTLLEMKNF